MTEDKSEHLYPVSIRVDLRDLALCASWLSSRGLSFRSRSDLGQLIIHTLATFLEDQTELKRTPTQAEAINVLRALGIDLETSTRTERAIRNILQAEDLNLERFGHDFFSAALDASEQKKPSFTIEESTDDS